MYDSRGQETLLKGPASGRQWEPLEPMIRALTQLDLTQSSVARGHVEALRNSRSSVYLKDGPFDVDKTAEPGFP